MSKLLLRLFLVILLIGGVLAYMGYTYISEPNIIEERDGEIFYLPSGSNYQAFLDTIINRKMLKNSSSFEAVAKAMDFGDSSIKPGRYQVKKSWSNRDLINTIKSGNQKGSSLVINNVRTIDDVIGSIASQIELDSLSLSNYLYSQEGLDLLGTDKENLITYFIPNTYEVWWNSSASQLVKRLKAEHEKWWSSKDRDKKIKASGLSREEAFTLASIVDKESNLNSEKPRVAGVYLNRIKRGIPLQADPTVVFATGEFELRRVLNKHLEYDSPYNTYKYPGLPPGPIYLASISGLNAVVDVENHDFLYFCAAPGYGSKHQFAKTLTKHNQNARKFHNWLNKQGIR